MATCVLSTCCQQLDSTECSYYSCDHSADYITTGSDGASNLTGDGVIYPAYTPFSGAEAGASTSQLYEPSYSPGGHAGAYYADCGDGCADEIVDPVLKPIEYPMGTVMALAPPAAVAGAAPAPKKGDQEAPAKPGPGHLMLMAPALLFGAAEATAKLLTNDDQSKGSWVSDFKAQSCRAADAVTPVGGFLLKRGMENKA